MVYEVGDIVKLKKPHPCGSQEWEILRVGADFRLKCMGCGPYGHGDETAGGEEYQRTQEAGWDGSKINGDWKRDAKTTGIQDYKK